MGSPTASLSALALAAGFVAATAGCWPFATTRSGGPGAGPRIMPPDEARTNLARAWEELYTNGKPGAGRAFALTDRVIRRCRIPRYAWEAHAVQVMALRADGDNPGATQVARTAIEIIVKALTRPPDKDGKEDKALAETGLTVLKMLLPLYVEAGACQEDENLIESLRTWKARLLERLPSGTGAPDADSIREEFELLEQMAEQHLSSRGPDTAVARAAERLLDALNARDRDRLLALLEPDSKPAKAVAAQGAAALLSASVDQVHLCSGFKTAVLRDEDGKPTAATVTFNLVVMSPAGWSHLLEGVRFVFTANAQGEWRIRAAEGLP